MKELAKKYDVPMSAIALNWVMCKGAIPLGGARNAQQAEQVGAPDCTFQNAKAMTFRLTDSEVDSLSAKGADGTT
jgi:aryl-alcohol dehydrogenase-like predicted oxidoreductase